MKTMRLGIEADDRVLIIGATAMIERPWHEVEGGLTTTDGDRAYLAMAKGGAAQVTYQGETVTVRRVDR